MKAVQKFKTLLDTKRPAALSGALGKGVRTAYPSSTMDGHSDLGLHKSRSTDLDDRKHAEAALASEGVHYKTSPPDLSATESTGGNVDSSNTNKTKPPHQHHKAHKLSPDD